MMLLSVAEDGEHGLPEQGVEAEDDRGDHGHRDQHDHGVPGHGPPVGPVHLPQLAGDLAAERTDGPEPRPARGRLAVPRRLLPLGLHLAKLLEALRLVGGALLAGHRPLGFPVHRERLLLTPEGACRSLRGGRPGGTRTPNHRFWRPGLYQLSYWPRVLGRPGPWAQSPSSIGATVRPGQGAPRAMAIVRVVTVFEQTGFDPRLEWGVEGARVLAAACRVVVVVDVLSFTTAIEVAVGRGAVVFPHRWPDPGAAAFARRVGAVLAGRRDEPRSTGAPPRGSPDPSGSTGAPPRGSPDPSGPGGRPPYSLSPVSLLDVPPGTRLVLPSPNGSALAAAIAHAGPVVLAGCLRNASAVARAAREAGGDGPVGVVAAGERRPDGALRPAVEDLLGAGAVLHALGGRPSPEARA